MVFFSSCSNQEPDLLKVGHFHLKDVNPIKDDAEMTRGEQLYRLRGAVTLKERESRLGHYYTVSWINDRPGTGPIRVVMNYQQAGTGSRILQLKNDLPRDDPSGKLEFLISGEAYRTGGRVLAWQIQLIRSSEVIAEERSYLWR